MTKKPTLLPLVYASIIGIVGFLCGFFGPIFLSPSANQGPMLGIFITGPGGALVGFVLGKIVASEPSKIRVVAAPIICAVIVAALTLYRSLPEDGYEGFIIDAELRSCQSPSTFVSAAEARWENEINKSTPEYKYRQDWKKDVPRMLATDKGVVLTLQVHRKRKIFEQRKPWNRGQLSATGWEKIEVSEKYFKRSADSACSDYKIGERAFYSPVWESSKVSPSDLLPQFLGLYTLQGVPGRFHEFTK